MRRAPSALPDDLTSRCRQQRCPEDWARLHPCLLCLPGGVTADDVIILTSLTRAEGTEAWSVDGIVRCSTVLPAGVQVRWFTDQLKPVAAREWRSHRGHP